MEKWQRSIAFANIITACRVTYDQEVGELTVLCSRGKWEEAEHFVKPRALKIILVRATYARTNERELVWSKVHDRT